jgi:hypothetical protein
LGSAPLLLPLDEELELLDEDELDEELLDDELELLLEELDDELLDELLELLLEDEELELLDDELVVPSHTPRLVYQPQLGQ